MEYKKIRRKQYYWIILFVVSLILLDQIIKQIVVQFLQEGSKVIIPNLLSFAITQNTGGAFGVGEGNIVMFIISNVVVLGIIIRFMITQKEQMDTKTRVCLSLILAGGFSNLWDRIVRGYVLDFIRIPYVPNFNMADMYIVVGWVAFCFIIAKYTFMEMKNKKKKKREI